MNENIIGFLILALGVTVCILGCKLYNKCGELDDCRLDVRGRGLQIAKLRDEQDKMVAIIDEMRKNKESTPEDCSLGPWCQSCAWVKKYYRYVSLKEGGVYDFYCGKAEACEHFQPGKQEDVEE